MASGIVAAGNTNLWGGVKNAQSDDLRLAGRVAPDAPPHELAEVVENSV